MAKLVVFGHDIHDAALRRRVSSFVRVGAQVQAMTMRRGPPLEAEWPNIDLGETRDAAFAQRILALAAAAPKVARYRDLLRGADIIYARNLDMLALAGWARKSSGSSARLVYECLDVHRFMTREDALGAAMRSVERALLKDVALVVVSSPGFVREYFDKRQPGRARTHLIENRLPDGFDYGPRRSATPPPEAGPLRIGWFGNLRCRRSLSLLLALARRFPDTLRIVMRGVPTTTDLPHFQQDIAGLANVQFGGRYAWPDDLASLYAGVDLVWAGDFHDAGANSRWLLPNRLYEGGYYAAPPVAPADSETARWMKERGVGFALEEPLEETFPRFIETLDRGAVAAARAQLLATPDDVFVQSPRELEELLAAIMA